MAIYRAILTLLLLVGLPAAALGAELPATYPGCGKTTARLNVRNIIHHDIVAVLPEGQTAWVNGPTPRGGWLEIEDQLDNTGLQHLAYGEYVVPHPLPDAEPVIREKTFLVLHDHTELDGDLYLAGTAFDYMGEVNGIYRIRGEDGVIEYNDEIEANRPYALFYELPVWWDYANRRPAVHASYTRERPLSGYYESLTWRMADPTFAFFIFILLSVLVILAAIGAGKWRWGLCFFLLALPLNMGTCQGEVYTRYLHRFDVAACYLASHQTEDGYVTPVAASWIDPGNEGRITDRKLGYFVWGPVFVALHLALIVLVPSAIAGVHYLFVRHPAEKQVSVPSPAGQLTQRVASGLRERERRPRRWVPTFVLNNFERRLRAKAEFLRAERELLDQAIETDRKKAEFESLRRDNA